MGFRNNVIRDGCKHIVYSSNSSRLMFVYVRSLSELLLDLKESNKMFVLAFF
jgi:hypothetical protein